MMSKREMRSEALRRRDEIPREAVRELSALVRKNVEALPEYAKAETVASYVSMDNEVQTSDLLRRALQRKKRVIVPRSDMRAGRLTFHDIHSLDELRPGAFGILEPQGSASVPLSDAQLILVPVVAWDYRGGRLGYGKGYFDRELRSKGRGLAAGLAFESQRRAALPLTPSDVPLDAVATEERVIRFGRANLA